MPPRPLVKDTDSYRVILGGQPLVRKDDGSEIIVEIHPFASDAQIVAALKRKNVLMKDVRVSQLTLRMPDTRPGNPFRTYVYSKREGLLFVLEEVM